MESHEDEDSGDPGFVTLFLDEDTQQLLNQLDLSFYKDSKKPNYLWDYVKKDDTILFLKHTRSKVFLQLKSKLNASHLDLIMIGYTSTAEGNKITICFSEEAIEETLEQIGLFDELSYNVLKSRVIKTPKEWKNNGSDKKILQWQAPNQRPLRTVEAIVPIKWGDKQKQLQGLNPENIKRCCASFTSSEMQSKLLLRRTVDVNLQACSLQDIEIQTTLNLPNKMWAQWEPQLKDEESLSEKDVAKLKSSVDKNSEQAIEAVHYNCMLNTYENDYLQLTQSIESKIYKNSYKLSHILNSYENNTEIVCCHSWHPQSKDIIAVGYRSNCQYSVADFKGKKDNGFNTDSFTAHCVIIWDCSSNSPKIYLESPNDIVCVKFCPYNPCLIVGGCKNGQIVLWKLPAICFQSQFSSKTTKTSTENQQKAHSQNNMDSTMKHTKEDSVSCLAPILTSTRCHSSSVSSLHWLSRKIMINQFGVMKAKDEDSLQVISTSEDGFIFVWDFLELPTDTDITNILKNSSTNEGVPFSILDKIIQPVYKVGVNCGNVRAVITTSCVTSISIQNLVEESSDISFDLNKKRVLYDEPINASLHGNLCLFIGTIDGDVAFIDFSSLEILEEQTTLEYNIKENGAVHDGPVLCLAQSPFDPNIVLSVGGHTFAIWTYKCQQLPIYIKHVSIYLSSGCWSLHRQSMFYIFGGNGTLQVWDLLNKKSVLDREQHLFPGSISAMPYELHCQRSKYLPLTDSKGTICFCVIPTSHMEVGIDEKVFMESCFDHSMAQMKIYEIDNILEVDQCVNKKEFNKTQWNIMEQNFLQFERERLMKKERTEMMQLEIQLKSCHIDTKKDAECKINLITHLPKSLFKLKNIDKKSLLKTHLPVVDLEEQELRKKLLHKRRITQTNNELAQKNGSIVTQAQSHVKRMPSDKKSDNTAAEKYFQDFKKAEKKFHLVIVS